MPGAGHPAVNRSLWGHSHTKSDSMCFVPGYPLKHGKGWKSDWLCSNYSPRESSFFTVSGRESLQFSGMDVQGLGRRGQREGTSAGATGVRGQQKLPEAGGCDPNVEGWVGIRPLPVGWDAGSRLREQGSEVQSRKVEGGGDLAVLYRVWGWWGWWGCAVRVVDAVLRSVHSGEGGGEPSRVLGRRHGWICMMGRSFSSSMEDGYQGSGVGGRGQGPIQNGGWARGILRVGRDQGLVTPQVRGIGRCWEWLNGGGSSSCTGVTVRGEWVWRRHWEVPLWICWVWGSCGTFQFTHLYHEH